MHLDPGQRLVPDRAVAESVDGDRAAKLAVDPIEQVEVERGRDPGRVVIGGHQHVFAFHPIHPDQQQRSEEHTSELQSLMRISYAVFCLYKKKITQSSLVSCYNTVHTPYDTL